MFENTDNLVQKSTFNYVCEKCNYKSSRKSQYERHLLTAKHKIRINTDEKSSTKLFYCICGKKYKHSQSLYNHKKICNFEESSAIINNENNMDYKTMFFEIINENKELRKQISEMIPMIGNNNNNNIKQKFNINVFLNEKCKDALSMDDFINKIEISMKNLLTTKEKGQTHGISNIIIENMNKLSLYERPLHCTDKKRVTLYVKNDKWEKDENKTIINKALKNVERKQMQNINVWLEQHPNYMKCTKEQEEFAKLLSESGKSVDEGREKIVKNVCDNVFLEKEHC